VKKFPENGLTSASVCTQHAHTHLFYVPLDFFWHYPGELVPEPIWILLKRETVSDSGIIWAICKSAPCPRQITTPAPHHSVHSMSVVWLFVVQCQRFWWLCTR